MMNLREKSGGNWGQGLTSEGDMALVYTDSVQPHKCSYKDMVEIAPNLGEMH